MTLTPFYVIHVLGFEFDKKASVSLEIALVPLVSYASSMIFSIFFYNWMVNIFGNRIHPLFIGMVLTVGSSIPFYFMQPSFAWLIFILVAIQGIGLSIILNIATSLISDVIGKDDKSSAFVFGVYGLVEKLINGILLVVIGNTVIQNEAWLRWLASALPAGCAFLTYIFAFIGKTCYADEMKNPSRNSLK
mmetsp:Transcript_14688/g.16401  ORF Transcript_14688/g.16401 Transcript_14688/m.16401 type:complete len:190 (-) Transcript_14688:41-610(-)